MPEAVVDGQRVYYVEKEKGTPVVLVHGFPLDHRVWEAQIEALSDRWRVIAPDLPGFGQSRSDRPFTMHSQADGLHAFLGQIGALPCVLAGLSMGGYIAFAYLTKYPSDLKGLMMVDTRCEGDSPEGKLGRGKMIETARTGGSAAVAAQMMPKMLSADAQQNRPQLVQRLKSIMEECPAKTIENALAAMRDRDDCRDKLASIAVPTLGIVGDSDAITPPESAQGMCREIPHAKLAIIKGAGHMSPMEQPEQVNQAMRGFLETA
jgi:3-oxoadipate enol-lactonase